MADRNGTGSGERRGSPIETIRALDQCWLKGDFEVLGDYFHPEAILLHATQDHRVVGRDAIVKSYIGFTKAVDITDFKTDGHEAHEIGVSAIVNYNWAMDWTQADTDSRHSAHGREYLTLQRTEKGWVVMTRLQVEH